VPAAPQLMPLTTSRVITSSVPDQDMIAARSEPSVALLPPLRALNDSEAVPPIICLASLASIGNKKPNFLFAVATVTLAAA